MSSTVKTCPQCGRMASAEENVSGHDAAHVSTHQMAHGHPVGAAIAAGAWLVGKLLPKTYHCANCGHSFSA